MEFFKEQIFLVTGASSGLGRATALMLNARGASVVAIARRKDMLDETKSQSQFPQNFFCEVKDLSDDIDGLPKYVKSLKDKYGKLSGLAYCAGITSIKPIQMLDLDESKKLFDIDYFAPIYMAKGFADRRVNIGKGASMAFISSTAALSSTRAMCDYSGAKAALAASVKCIARELAPSGVRANCVSPSLIKTEMTTQYDGIDIIGNLGGRYPMGVGEPVDVANLICFLLSSRAKWITGQNYIIDCATL